MIYIIIYLLGFFITLGITSLLLRKQYFEAENDEERKHILCWTWWKQVTFYNYIDNEYEQHLGGLSYIVLLSGIWPLSISVLIVGEILRFLWITIGRGTIRIIEFLWNTITENITGVLQRIITSGDKKIRKEKL